MASSSRRYCCCCSNYKGKVVDGRIISLHTFPKEKSQKRLWVRRLHLVSRKFKGVKKDTRVCSEHFINKLGPVPGDDIPSVFATRTFKTSSLNEEIDERVQKGFIYLTEKSLLQQWRLVGTQENLFKDVDIAQFLLSRYFGHSEKAKADTRCQMCSSPLLAIWRCLNCPRQFVFVQPDQKLVQLVEAGNVKPLKAMPVVQEENKTLNAAIDLQSLVSLDMLCEDIEEADCNPKATPECKEYPTIHPEKNKILICLLAPPNLKPLQDLASSSKKTALPAIKISENAHIGNPLNSPFKSENFEKQSKYISDTISVVNKSAGNGSAQNVKRLTVMESGQHKTFHNKKLKSQEKMLSARIVLSSKEKLHGGDSQTISSEDLASKGGTGDTVCNTLSFDQLAGTIDAAKPTKEQGQKTIVLDKRTNHDPIAADLHTLSQKTARLSKVNEKTEHLNCDEDSASQYMECYSRTDAFHSYCMSPNVICSRKEKVDMPLSPSLQLDTAPKFVAKDCPPHTLMPSDFVTVNKRMHHYMNEPTFDAKTKKQVQRVNLLENVNLPENGLSLNVSVLQKIDSPISPSGGGESTKLSSVADDLVQPGIHPRNLVATATGRHFDYHYDTNAAADFSCPYEDASFSDLAVGAQCEVEVDDELAEKSQSEKRLANADLCVEKLFYFDNEVLVGSRESCLQSVADDDVVQHGIHSRNLVVTASETHCDYDKNTAGDLSCLHEETDFKASAVQITQSPKRLADSDQDQFVDSEEVAVETSESQKKMSAVLSTETPCDLVSNTKRCSFISLQGQNSPLKNRKGKAQQNNQVRNECTICHKTFSTKYYLKLHILAKHKPPRFVCEFCSLVCLTHGMLITHLQIHSSQRPYLCEYCGKGFKLVARLREHIKRHLGIKVYSCKECGKSFAQSHAVKVHALTHTKEKRHVCGVCGKAFGIVYNMRAHQRRHENESYRPQKVASK